MVIVSNYRENRAVLLKATLDSLGYDRRRTSDAPFRDVATRVGSNMKAIVAKFLKDESGATAIEYGLIAAGIAIAIIAAVNGVGTQLSSTFSSISTSLK